MGEQPEPGRGGTTERQRGGDHPPATARSGLWRGRIGCENVVTRQVVAGKLVRGHVIRGQGEFGGGLGLGLGNPQTRGGRRIVAREVPRVDARWRHRPVHCPYRAPGRTDQGQRHDVPGPFAIHDEEPCHEARQHPRHAAARGRS